MLETRPENFGYDTTLWTCDLLAALISRHYNVQVIGATINHHLHQLGLTNQQPNYRPLEQDPAVVERYLKNSQKYRDLLARLGPRLALRTQRLLTYANGQEKLGVNAVLDPMSL